MQFKLDSKREVKKKYVKLIILEKNWKKLKRENIVGRREQSIRSIACIKKWMSKVKTIDIGYFI